MGRYYILIEQWAVYVKEEKFFQDQGGLLEKWGAKWKLIEADSIEDARNRGLVIRDKERY